MVAVRSFIAVMALASLGTPAYSKSVKPTPTPSKGCFEQRLTPIGSGVQRILVDFNGPKVRVEYNGGRNVPFMMDGCDQKSGAETIRCQAVCDGGSALFTLVAGKLRLETDGIRTNGALDTAIPMTEDADGGKLVGRFELKPVSPQVCIGAFDDVENLSSLQRGDFSPRVAAVKKNLADLGYLVQRPDWYFDGPSTSAVSAFQRSAGLPVSGIADAETISKLKMVARLKGGC